MIGYELCPECRKQRKLNLLTKNEITQRKEWYKNKDVDCLICPMCLAANSNMDNFFMGGESK